MQKTKQIPSFKLIGLALAGKTHNENGQSSIDCGKLWQQFMEEGIASRIPDKLSEDIYAVYYAYEGDHTAPFSYFIGSPAKPDTTCPEDLKELLVPDGDFLPYTAKGKMPDCLVNAWQEIWRSDIPRSYQYDFEIYGQKSQNWEDAEVVIYLGVE